MIRINQVKIKAEQGAKRENAVKLLRKKAADILKVRESDFLSFSIVRESVDARKKPEIFYSYTLEVSLPSEEKVLKRVKNSQVSRGEACEYHFPACGTKKQTERPVIAGMGPAGLFCGYFLALYGYRPILLERGEDVDTRQRQVEEFWNTGKLNPDSNVQFGEGGAGTFSDGKLNTLVKDKDGRNQAVLRTFVQFGAKESIRYEAKPHIGTDVLRQIVKRMREEIIKLGGEVRFGCTVTDVEIQKGRISGVWVKEKGRDVPGLLPCRELVLAIGHSARDTFQMLYDRQIPMEAKAFAVGLRVEHSQKKINFSQYGREEAGVLGAAPYKVTAKTSVGRGVYSFCMCPGGYVVNASSEEGRLAVNGMSYSGRDGANANSAIIVAVTPEDFGSSHPLAGIAFQRSLEEKAFRLGQGKVPVQRYGDFRQCTEAQCEGWSAEQEEGVLQPSIKGQYIFADVSRILPKECNLAFIEAMEQFGRQIPGFDAPDTLLSGVESRTSSPVRIHREEDMQSQIKGLYPCGEGAGYAGGITSAAMDGIRIAEAIAAEYAPANPTADRNAGIDGSGNLQ